MILKSGSGDQHNTFDPHVSANAGNDFAKVEGKHLMTNTTKRCILIGMIAFIRLGFEFEHINKQFISINSNLQLGRLAQCKVKDIF